MEAIITLPDELVTRRTVEHKHTSDNKQSSVDVTKNTKGYNWSIKMYYDQDKNEEEDVLSRIKAIDATLRNQYGQPTNGNGAAPTK